MSRAPHMTPAQRSAHDATVSILQRYCDEAEAHLRARADATVSILQRYCDEAEAHLRARADATRDAVRDKLCPCGIQMTRCQCPLATSRAVAHPVVGEP